MEYVTVNASSFKKGQEITDDNLDKLKPGMVLKGSKNEIVLLYYSKMVATWGYIEKKKFTGNISDYIPNKGGRKKPKHISKWDLAEGFKYVETIK